MRIPSCIPLVGIGLTIAGCGSSESPAPEALLFTVNGARQPVVFPGDTAVWGGFGFGTEPGAGVLVSATGGLAPAQVLSWSGGAIQGVLPEDAASGPTYVLTATDSLGPLDLVVRPRTTFDPAARGWVEDAALPVPLAGAAAAALRFPEPTGVASLVVLTGGRQGDGRLSDSTYLGPPMPPMTGTPKLVIPLGKFVRAIYFLLAGSPPPSGVRRQAYRTLHEDR